MERSVPATNDLKRYEMEMKLGEGTYGVVYKAKDKITGEVSSFSNHFSSPSAP